MTDSLGRRDFIKAAGVAGAALMGGTLLAGCSPNAAAETTAEGISAADVSWDEETDVLVVGSGFAGLAAAIEALDAGSEVVLIDKMPVYGGNSALNGGDMAAVGTPLQKAAGVEDSIELMVNDMLVAGKHYNHVERTRAVAENSAAAVEWCESLGVEFAQLHFHGGHSVPRPHSTSGSSGGDIIKAQVARLEALGGGVPLNPNSSIWSRPRAAAASAPRCARATASARRTAARPSSSRRTRASCSPRAGSQTTCR